MKKLFAIILVLVLALTLVACGDTDNNPENNVDEEEVIEVLEPGRAEKVGDTETILGEEYVLTFIDNFGKSTLDTTKWEYCPEWTRADMGGKWDPKCANPEDGKMVLSVIFDPEAGCYKSGAIRTKGIFEQAYGYFEASMRVQDIPGFWSAFWMMCGDVNNVGNDGVDGTEIDIMEAYNYESFGINHALHWDGYGEAHQSVGTNEYREDLYDGEFHTYSMRWSPEGYKWYIDGELMWESNAGGVCNQPGYMKLTLEVGTWAGKISFKDLPATVEIDYVRAYQFADMAE